MLFLSVSGWAQGFQLTGANTAPLEGPAAGSDTVLVYASGVQGSSPETVAVTTDASWITMLTGASSMSIQNGPNRVQFQFAANTGAWRQGHIVLLNAGSPAVTITVTQADAGSVPAGPLPVVTSVNGPKAIDVDPQGNLFIMEVNGQSLYEWSPANQQLTTLVTNRAQNTFVDLALDGAADLFALEDTPDGNLGSQVELIQGPDLYLPPPLFFGKSVFYSEDAKYLFPAGVCVDPAGKNLNITAVGASNKCLIDQFGTVYELDSVDDNENLGSFASAPTNANYSRPPVGTTFFPTVPNYSDPCGNQLPGVTGSLYGLTKDGSGFVYFVDQNGGRLNRYDPSAKWATCTTPPDANGNYLVYPSYGTFTTLATLTYPAYYAAADTTGNVYLSSMPFSRIDEIPRAYVLATAPFNEPIGGGSGTIQVLPVTQSLQGVFAPVSSDTSWLYLTGAANGVVTFACSPNYGPTRTGTITVLGVPIKVVQAESQVPAAMTMVAGNKQSASVGGLPFPINLLVKVTNIWGDPAANATVHFISPTQNIPVITDASGYASTTAMNAYAVGASNVTASISGFPISQVFQLTGTASGISVVSGSNQSAQLNTQFPQMVAQVIGANGLPIPGVPVTFSAPASGASGTFLSSNSTTVTVNTASDGTVSPGAFQANGTYGSYVVTASISGVTGVTSSTCTFNLTNFGQVQELVGNQTAIVNNAYASPLGIKVVDGNNNPIANAPVFFQVGAGQGVGAGAVFPNGSSSVSLLTGADGIIWTQPMTATANAGTYNATAVVTLPNGSGLIAYWTLTNTLSSIVSGAFQNGVTTRTLTQPLIVQASPNATAGTMVFTVVPGTNGSGGSFNGQSSVTVNLDSQGYGISPLLKTNGSPGTFSVTAYDGVATVQSTVATTDCLNNYAPSVVTNTFDYNPQSTGSTIYGSLRYVLANACSGATIDLTQLNPGLTISLTGGRMRIDDDMNITGPVPSSGSGPVAINGGGQSRLFFIGNGSVTISNLLLENGLAKGGTSVFGGGGAGMGGAIFIEGGNVTLSNVELLSNSVVGGGSGVASQCTTNCLYGGGGFAGDAGGGVYPGIGGISGDLFGMAGLTEGAPGDIGGGGAAAAIFTPGQLLPNPNGGNGGFGAGGGSGWYNGGATSSGNGGFGGGGGGGFNGTSNPVSVAEVLAGTGGYGGGNGYEPPFSLSAGAYVNFGGSGAGFGGAVFLYAGQLTLNTVDFSGNHAVAGTLNGLSGQPTVTGQAKGGALFVYDGALVINNGSTFGNLGPNYAADAGLPGHGNSSAPYTNGALCPGNDTADVCGLFGNASAVSITVPAGQTFSINGLTYTGSQTLNLSQGQYTLAAPGPQAISATSQIAFASWSDGGAPSHTITVGPTGLSITGTFVTQYLLTNSAGAGGAAFPVTSFFNANSVVNLNAAPSVGSAFTNWTGPVAAAGSAVTTVTMTGPQTVMANFTQTQLVNVIVPPGVAYTLNGVTYASQQYVSLPAGQYTLSALSPQVIGSGDLEFSFSSWSDGGALSHSITVGASAVSIVGSFSTQYQLTANAGSGGTISPVGGFYNSGAVVNLTATPNPGYVFLNWTGGVAAASSASTTVTMSQAETVTANFWPAPSACVAAPANIAAWWKGDGSVNDETTLNNVTLGGDVSFATGLVGQAFSFDGTQSPYVSIPSGAFPVEPSNAPFSFETWFQTVGGNGGVILGEQSGAPYGTNLQGWTPAIYVGTDNDLHVEMFYNGTTNQTVSSVPVNDNKWHHVAVTYDGSSEIAYLDGTNIGQSVSFTQALNGSPLSYQLGTGYTSAWPAGNSGWYTFNGLIDEPTTYSRALSAAEVLSIAQAGSYGKCDPVASANPSTINFATLPPGQTATQTAVLSNPGNAPLAISFIAADAGDLNFSLLSGNAGDCAVNAPVQPSGSCNVRVQFAPQGNGAVSGTISITDNSVASLGTQIISLAGSGPLQPIVTFTGPLSAVYGSTFTPVLSTNSGATAVIAASGSCQVSGTVVTMTAGTLQCQLQASWPANGAFAAATASLSVNAIQIVVTATVSVANKVVDGTTVATLSSCTLSNLLPADAGNVSCGASSATFASSGVGNNIPVTVNGLALSGPAAANYQLSSTTAASTANITFGTDSACIAPPTGVTAWWRGDGDATDVTGAYNGVLNGDVSFASGLVGQAFSFDGTQSPYVTLPAGAFPAEPSNGPFSFETWFQTAGGNGGVILGEQSGNVYSTFNLEGWTPAIYVGTDGKLYAQMFYSFRRNVPVASAVQVNDNAWHHVAVTYDGTNEVVYLDGGAIGTINQLVQTFNGLSPSYQLGTAYTSNWPATNGGWYTFNGLIDEVAIYSRALSSSEVAGIVQADSYGKCNPEASISPATLTYSALPSGQTAALTSVVSNPGNAPLIISSIAPDTGDTNFSVLSGSAGDCALGTPVQPSTSCNVRVQFAPQSTGSLTGSVTLQENSLYNAGAQTIQLAGTSSGSQTITFPSIGTQTVGTPLTLTATASSGLAVSFTSTTPMVCSVTGNTATFLTFGNCTVTAAQSGAGSYSAASPVSQTFAVVATQTITFPSIATQTVGAPLTLAATASSGLAVSYTSTTPTVCSVTGNTATFLTYGSCTVNAAQAGTGNYTAASPVSQTFAVVASQTITFASIATQTVGTPLTLTATASSGLAVSFTTTTPTVCSISGNTATFLTYGNCTVTAAQSGNASYSAASPVSQTFAVVAPQTITFPSIGSQTVGTPLTLTATASSGLAVSFTSTTPTICSVLGNTATFLTYGNCTVTATQAGTGNYSAASPISQTFAVVATQTITFPSIATQTVGTPLTLTATASSGLAVSFMSTTPTICSVLGNTATFLTYGNCTVTATQAGTGNYSAASPISQTFAVVATQTITFPSIATQTVGTPLTLTATASSGLAVSFMSTTPTVCSVSGNTATFLTYGNCTVTAMQAGNATYATAKAVSQTFAVISPQTITFPGIGSQMLGTPLVLTADATSGLPVSYTASPSSVCSVSGSTASFIATGTCTIKASQAGNANYLPAASVMQSFSVGKEAQSITWATIPSQTVLQTVSLTASASSGLPVTYASSSSSICTVSANTASLIAGGTCTIKATQAGNGTYASQTVSQSFTVNKLAQTITFAAIATPQSVNAQAALSATSTSGLAVTIALSPATVCTVSGTTVSFIAAGTCKLTATQPGTSVYAAATAVSQSIVVSKIAQTISFASIASQIAGSSLALKATASSALTVTYTASPSSVCTVSGSTATFVAGGTCTIAANQAGNAVYSAAASVSQSFLVTKVSQSIAFPSIAPQNVNASVTLAATATSGLTVTYAATPSSVCKVLGSTASMTGSGTCTITASQAGNGVYAAATSVPQSFVVSKLAQSISFGSISTQTVGASLNLAATASSGLTVSYSASPSSVCKVSGTTATMAGSGTCTISASQAGNSVYAAATVVPVSFVVNKVTQTISFVSVATQTVGTPLTLTAIASSGLAVTYTASPSTICKVSGSTASFVAAGTCTVVANQAGNTTYSAAAPVSQSFLVQK